MFGEHGKNIHLHQAFAFFGDPFLSIGITKPLRDPIMVSALDSLPLGIRTFSQAFDLPLRCHFRQGAFNGGTTNPWTLMQKVAHGELLRETFDGVADYFALGPPRGVANLRGPVVCRIGAKDAWIGDNGSSIGEKGYLIGAMASLIGAKIPESGGLGCKKPPPDPHPPVGIAPSAPLDRNIEYFSGRWRKEVNLAAPGHARGGQAPRDGSGRGQGQAIIPLNNKELRRGDRAAAPG